uniref:Uncharacterized protein n=1 Tax=Arundo donax TaxID=35708 RepID=A0A0A9B281_ARUDO
MTTLFLFQCSLLPLYIILTYS